MLTLRRLFKRVNNPVSDALPETVIETLHTVLGDNVGTSCGPDPPKHASHVDHPSPGLFDEWQHAQGHRDYAVQVHLQHGIIVIDGQPITGG